MTQASLPPDLDVATPSSRQDDPADATSGGRAALTLWLFGLTAMTLIFASLLLLGLLMRSGVLDSGIQGAIGAYAALIAGIGLVAVVYVLAMGRRQGIFKALVGPVDVVEVSTETEGLFFAPTVLPLAPAYRRERMAQAQESRSERARAIATAAAAASNRHQATGVVTASTATSPWPPVRPMSRPVITLPTSASAVASIRPASTAFRGMSPRPPAPRVQANALQLRSASLRAPFWDGPLDLTMADLVAGRGMRRPSLPPARTMPRSMSPPPMPASAPARAGSPPNDARLATPSGRGAAW